MLVGVGEGEMKRNEGRRQTATEEDTMVEGRDRSVRGGEKTKKKKGDGLGQKREERKGAWV